MKTKITASNGMGIALPHFGNATPTGATLTGMNSFEADNPPLPTFLNNQPFMEDATVEAELVYQWEDYREWGPEWEDCSFEDYKAFENESIRLVNTRQIWRILPPAAVNLTSGEQREFKKPKVVCYCGSLRVALEAFKKAEYEAVLKGEIALLPCCMFVDIQREYGAESDYKIKADDLHKRKIDICDEVFVLNVGGYIGESTRSEIDYALSINKPVKYLEPLTNH